MRRRYKVLGVILALVGVAVLSFALFLSHDSPCGPAPVLPNNTNLMKSIVSRCYGTADVLKYEDTAKPTPADNQVLVKVHAASVNPLDWHYMRGTPYIERLEAGFGKPDDPRMGVDFAGTVEAVGKNVKQFKPGDEVFGAGDGAFAEYVTVQEQRALALKPPNLTFEQAAAVPIAAITALQALRDRGRIQSGKRVLIIGASGGVGTFAVQIAKSYGAEVTGVCSTRNVEMVRSLGADHVIDYTTEDVTKSGHQYDMIVDNVGNRSLSELLSFRQILTPQGVFVLIGGGGPDAGPWLGPLATLLEERMISPFVSQKFVWLIAELNKEDLTILGDLMQAWKVTPVIDRTYKLSETPEALRYLEKGHARGKVVISLE